jgi:branched-chain amino acid transport system substrate-binding protein
MTRTPLFGAALFGALACAGIAEAEIRIGLAAVLSGDVSWIGEQQEIGARRAVADINVAGGLLGEQVELVTLDDSCDPELAAAVARQLIEEQVVFVNGHSCSGASLAAAPLYSEAGILMITSSSTNPALTEAGWSTVFRVTGRDDDQGRLAGNFIADRWPDAKIAIVHDGLAYGMGLAEETLRQLSARGIEPAIYEAFDAGQVDFTDIVDRLEAAEIEVIYAGSYHVEAAMILKQAVQRGMDLQLIGGDALAGDDFLIYTGEEGVGTLFTFGPDPRDLPSGAEVVRAFREEEGFEPAGYTLHSYAAVQVWAEAVRRAQSTDADAVAAALRSDAFESVLGTLHFDGKGDVSGGADYMFYIWGDDSHRPFD